MPGSESKAMPEIYDNSIAYFFITSGITNQTKLLNELLTLEFEQAAKIWTYLQHMKPEETILMKIQIRTPFCK